MQSGQLQRCSEVFYKVGGSRLVKCGADSYNAALKYSIRWGESACKVQSGQLQRCSEVFDKVGGVGL